MYAAMFVVLGFLAYIWIRFEFKFAVAALITTLHDVVVVAGWFALSGHEFDLTVLAGILSVMGYSINDTIVVFDRVRENFRTLHKLSPIEILNRSINRRCRARSSRRSWHCSPCWRCISSPARHCAAWPRH